MLVTHSEPPDLTSVNTSGNNLEINKKLFGTEWVKKAHKQCIINEVGLGFFVT